MFGIVNSNIINYKGETNINPKAKLTGKKIGKGKIGEKMYEINLAFKLPLPWVNKKFQTNKIGYLNFLVGPNATGKTRFAEVLKENLNKCRYLSSDRLSGISFRPSDGPNLIDNVFEFREGIKKEKFATYKEEANHKGIGADAFIILEEKLELRIKVEAVLSQLFNRDIRFDWDSGNLVPTVFDIQQEQSYKLLNDECLGLKELIVLLTHMYDDSHDFLIIDEPELNLHPQFQAFLLQEIRKIVGSPSLPRKKIIF